MERCPDKGTLAKFVEHELSEEVNTKILSHMKICESCREEIASLLSEDQSLLRSLLSEPLGLKKSKTKATATCLSKAAILAYVAKCLSEDQLKLVESHLQKCDNCMSDLLRLQASMNLPTDLHLDMAVLLLGKRIASTKSRSILEIILGAKDKFVDLIRHTGELILPMPQLAALRGEKAEQDDSIILRKDFPDRNLSVEVTVGRLIDESGIALKVSLMALDSEEFMPGIAVELFGESTSNKGITNDDGTIEFYGIESGTYDITISGELTSHVEFR
jgi:hypothetical protein